MSVTQVDDEMEGVEVENTPLMTEEEKRVLEVYDRLEELQLEIALLKAQGILSQDPPPEATEENTKAAEQELLKARAKYQVRKSVIEQTLIANPIVKAIHATSKASIAEQDLLPLIQERDKLSVTLSGLSTKVLNANGELRKVESEHMILSRENAKLAAQMLELAAQANTLRKEDIEDPKARKELDDLEREAKSSRARWRIMKGTASGTIAGSGVDWARDPKLLEIVLDKEGEDG